MEVERTALPGLGVRVVVTTASDQEIGVVQLRTGRRVLVVYRVDDPDSAHSVTLARHEAAALARLLCPCHETPSPQAHVGAR